jgi:hypothetical protein
MNKLYIVDWPDGTISILSAESKKDLFWSIDSEADPYAPKITEVTTKYDIHIATYLHTNKKNQTSIKWHLGPESDYGSKKKVIQNKKKSYFGGLEDYIEGAVGTVPDEAYQELGFKAAAK